MSHLLAAGASTGNDTLDLLLPFLNLGVVVVVLYMIVRKVGLVPAWTMTEQEKAHTKALADAEESRRRELAAKDAIIAGLEADKAHLRQVSESLQAAFREQVIPALTKANEVAGDYVDALRRHSMGGS